MKKLFCVLLAALLLCTLAACGHEDTAQKPAAEDAEGTAAVDIDLTVLSGIMVYSEVNSMISFPDNYIGKTVKMQGQFTIYQATDENGTFIPDKMFFACMIADAPPAAHRGWSLPSPESPSIPMIIRSWGQRSPWWVRLNGTRRMVSGTTGWETHRL